MVHLNWTVCGNGSDISQTYFRIARGFSFVHQKHEFGSPDADRIAVFNDFATHRNSIHKSTVVAVEIDDLQVTTKTLPDFAGLWSGLLST